MPDLHRLLLFIAAGVVLKLTPGPDVMFIVANAVRGGLRAGVAAPLRISALLAASQTTFAVLKWVGALYLAWVGTQMLRGAWKRPALVQATDTMNTGAPHADGPVVHGLFDSKMAASAESNTGAALAPVWPVLRRGFLTNVLNPKVALFFLVAFMPQFIAPGRPHPGGVFAALGLLLTFNGLLVACAWALVAAPPGPRAAPAPCSARCAGWPAWPAGCSSSLASNWR